MYMTHKSWKVGFAAQVCIDERSIRLSSRETVLRQQQEFAWWCVIGLMRIASS